MAFNFQNKDFKDFVLATVLVLACFLGYVYHPYFWPGQFIFLILLVVNPLLFGYVSKRQIMSFIVGFLPLILMVLYRIPMAFVFPDHVVEELITMFPGALLLGIGGYFAARTNGDKKILNLGIGVLFVLAMIALYLYIYL
ncbi:hypothetical protein [Methanimicrococcus blatticola]|uniref:Uncharacterized protein n=1 Tax=Methanimicrococcus blatticola TaxID=91560 RepID=A0A484F3D4_9EURY|nr:hypothetical protein [Methanimicrococcus blatticola]MBZ3935389.1 hypothetical protein [Methanimicrococcus blatticola]MCC2508513.1 hypothetical protein [Methanimicrococcus blatticola]TDQ67823.1 hypothetical protein C7391_1376 [Methanimicrococcus blatticola]